MAPHPIPCVIVEFIVFAFAQFGLELPQKAPAFGKSGAHLRGREQPRAFVVEVIGEEQVGGRARLQKAFHVRAGDERLHQRVLDLDHNLVQLDGLCLAPGLAYLSRAIGVAAVRYLAQMIDVVGTGDKALEDCARIGRCVQPCGLARQPLDQPTYRRRRDQPGFQRLIDGGIRQHQPRIAPVDLAGVAFAREPQPDDIVGIAREDLDRGINRRFLEHLE